MICGPKKSKIRRKYAKLSVLKSAAPNNYKHQVQLRHKFRDEAQIDAILILKAGHLTPQKLPRTHLLNMKLNTQKNLGHCSKMMIRRNSTRSLLMRLTS